MICYGDARFIKKVEQPVYTGEKKEELAPIERGIRCVETGEVFKNPVEAAKQLAGLGYESAARSIRLALSGKQERAYGRHWVWFDGETEMAD